MLLSPMLPRRVPPVRAPWKPCAALPQGELRGPGPMVMPGRSHHSCPLDSGAVRMGQAGLPRDKTEPTGLAPLSRGIIIQTGGKRIRAWRADYHGGDGGTPG